MLARFAAILALGASALGAQTPAPAQAPAQVLPEVGAVAPDFAVPGSVAGVARNVRLADYRGQTVVLVFFPGARTSGCTVQLTKYRDEYKTIFAGGEKVTVIGISTDADTTQATWAREAGFPFAFASDADLAISKAYGSVRGTRSSRNVFVIAPDGRIASRMVSFNVNAEVAYADLAKLVSEASSRR